MQKMGSNYKKWPRFKYVQQLKICHSHKISVIWQIVFIWRSSLLQRNDWNINSHLKSFLMFPHVRTFASLCIIFITFLFTYFWRLLHTFAKEKSTDTYMRNGRVLYSFVQNKIKLKVWLCLRLSNMLCLTGMGFSF